MHHHPLKIGLQEIQCIYFSLHYLNSLNTSRSIFCNICVCVFGHVLVFNFISLCFFVFYLFISYNLPCLYVSVVGCCWVWVMGRSRSWWVWMGQSGCFAMISCFVYVSAKFLMLEIPVVKKIIILSNNTLLKAAEDRWLLSKGVV